MPANRVDTIDVFNCRTTRTLTKRRKVIVGCQVLLLSISMIVGVAWVRAALDPPHASLNAPELSTTQDDSGTALITLVLIGLLIITAVTVAGATLLASPTVDAQQHDDDRARELLHTRDAVIAALGMFAEYRDHETGQHLERIRSYVLILARSLQTDHAALYPQIDDQWIHDLCTASALHDIGKVGIPDEILLKPGQLDANERAMIEDHPIIGGECLAEMEKRLGHSDFLEIAREVAYSHHEWWNGTGYPFKLACEAIPLSARIVSLADVYDALTSPRAYKSALPHDEAVDIIASGRETQFDPCVVDAFLKHASEFEQVAIALNVSDLERADEASVTVYLDELRR